MRTGTNPIPACMVAMMLFAASAVSCIKNDTPWPTVKGAIITLEVEGQNRVSIDAMARTVVIDLHETVDPANVRIVGVELSPTGVSEQLRSGAFLDLSSPMEVVVKTVAEYRWTISATQTIERRFVIEPNQIGDAHFEPESRNVFAFVTKGTDLTKIKVTQLKLGPEGATMSPDLTKEETVSFRASSSGDGAKVREVQVSYRDVVETWSLFVTETDTQLNRVHAFAGRVYLVGSGQGGLDNGFEYRRAAVAEWTRIPDAQVQHNGGVFSTWLRGLTPETDYVVRAFSGENFSPEHPFTTESVRALPDGSLDKWHLAGKVWNPWELGGEQWWDTGNQGATTLGDSNSVPTAFGEGSPANPAGRAAFLETKFVGLGPAGKIAGGNLYFGEYYRTVGTNGIVNMGKAWQHRPSFLKGWYKYLPQRITDVGTLHSAERDRWMGAPDSLHIMVALWASPDGQTRPYQANTDPNNFVIFDENVPGIIAFGDFASSATQAEWGEFSIEFEYRNTGRLPANTVLLVVVTASKYANYFTGGRGSVLYLDELWLDYETGEQ